MLQGNLKDCFTYAKLFCFVVSTRMEDSLLDWRRLIVANCTWPKESKRRGHMWRALPVNSACGSSPGTLNELSYMGPTLPSVLGCPKGQQIFLAMIPISNESIVPKEYKNSKGCTFFGHVPIFIFIFYFFCVLLCLLWSPFEKFEKIEWLIWHVHFASSYLTNGKETLLESFSLKSPYLHPVFGHAFRVRSAK